MQAVLADVQLGTEQSASLMHHRTSQMQAADYLLPRALGAQLHMGIARNANNARVVLVHLLQLSAETMLLCERELWR